MSLTDNVFAELEEKVAEQLAHYKKELAKVQTGRANPDILDGIRIEYYGTLTPLNQVGAVKVPEARQLVIEPWDKGTLHDIEKAIATSDLGITPTNDGQLIRITLPALTEERRKELVKTVNEKAEETKGHLRQLRNKYKDQLKDDKELSEDDLKREEKNLQEIFDKANATIDDLKSKKSDEIMEV